MANLQAQLEVYKDQLNKFLHDNKTVSDIFDKIEEKTKMKRLNIALGGIAFFLLYLMVGYGAQFFCNFVGFLYPAYRSIKAIESDQKDDDTQWLTYWVVYSFFALVEFFSDHLLFWIPFYWLLKMMFLLYCMAPTTWNGSLTIYKRFILPLFKKYEGRLDEMASKGGAMAGEVGKNLAAEGVKAAAEYQADQLSGTKTD